MADLLLSLVKAVGEWDKRGARVVPAEERDSWVPHYISLRRTVPSAEGVPKGRSKQSTAYNLLDAFLHRTD